MSEDRKCAWCGGGMSNRPAQAKFCNGICRQRSKSFVRALEEGHWPKEMYGPRNKATCPQCGGDFERSDPRQIYCERGGRCAQAAFRESDTWVAYASREDVRERWRAASRRHAATDHGKAAQKERDSRPENVSRRRDYAQSEHGKAVRRENQRAAAAHRAIAAILLPAEQRPEE